MQSMKFLNSKEKRDMMRRLEENYGLASPLNGNMLLSTKEKIYLLSDSDLIRSGQERELRIDRAGLHIGTLAPNGIRLSVEGSQLIGPLARKNVLEIEQEHLEPWVKGEDFLLSEKEIGQTGGANGIFMIRNGKDFLGSTIVKDNRVQNCLSKNRRVKNLNH